MELPVHVHVCLGSTEFFFFFKHTQITKIVSQVQINPLNDSSFMQPYEEWIALSNRMRFLLNFCIQITRLSSGL